VNAAAASVLPLKRYAEFGGRSTRTELLSFYLLVSIAGALLDTAAKWSGHPEATALLATALLAAVFIPSLAVGTRRLHDTGRSGRWLLLALPVPLTVIADYAAYPRAWALPVRFELPWWGVAPALVCLTALIIQLLRDDAVDANLYGPNPRGWPQGVTT
jgi:uncharacterized membrane protein YhaH (DUF805 family)